MTSPAGNFYRIYYIFTNFLYILFLLPPKPIRGPHTENKSPGRRLFSVWGLWVRQRVRQYPWGEVLRHVRWLVDNSCFFTTTLSKPALIGRHKRANISKFSKVTCVVDVWPCVCAASVCSLFSGVLAFLCWSCLVFVCFLLLKQTFRGFSCIFLSFVWLVWGASSCMFLHIKMYVVSR